MSTTSTRIDHETIGMSLSRRRRRNQEMTMALERQQVSEADHQRGRKRALEDEAHDLMVANRKLQEDLEEANDLINFWANGSEAFRRTIHHLKKNWQPAPGEEQDLNKIVDKEHADLRANTEWQNKKSASSEARRKAFRETKPRKSKPG